METLYLLLLLLVPILLLLFIRRGSPRRYAVLRVIRTFKRREALGAESALTEEALGLKVKEPSGNPFIGILFGMGLSENEGIKDALHYLMREGVVMRTEDRRLYLSEEKLKEKRFL